MSTTTEGEITSKAKGSDVKAGGPKTGEGTSSERATNGNGEKKVEPSAPLDLAERLRSMKTAHRHGKVATYDQRVGRLDRLEKTMLGHKDDIVRAIREDFGTRSKYESLLGEVFIVRTNIDYARDHLREWMDVDPRQVKWTFFPGRAEVIPQPLGVVGIISPWNYPVQLALGPLVCALAAGNRAMLKPSELAPKTAELLAKMMREAFDELEVTVVTGGADVGEAFTKLPFDHLVFTGSTRVGKLVMRAAAENLTPVTLELGGKSPAIVGADFPVDEAASRILAGKAFNAGQTCIAPDYVLLPEAMLQPFVEASRSAIAKMFPRLADNEDYTSIVNEAHYRRLQGLLADAKEKGARIVELNPAKEEFAEKGRKIAPTLILGATDEMLVMQEEIFGPLLPVKTIGSLDHAIDYVNEHPRPLALYYFGYDQLGIDRVLEETISGGVSINETLLHCAQDDLPFGGVGASGMGHYHAREGFEAFTKKKPIFYQGRLNSTSFLRPPYGKAVDLLLKVLLGG